MVRRSPKPWVTFSIALRRPSRGSSDPAAHWLQIWLSAALTTATPDVGLVYISDWPAGAIVAGLQKKLPKLLVLGPVTPFSAARAGWPSGLVNGRSMFL